MVRGGIWLFVGLLAACGNTAPGELETSVATQRAPLVTRVAPTAGKAGDTITIFGLGFSSEAQQNIVLMGGAAATASAYALVSPPAAGEIEQLTFTLPGGAAAGATTIAVAVVAQVSNSNVAFTVTP